MSALLLVSLLAQAPVAPAERPLPAVETLTFDAVIARALERNPSALVAAQNVRRAQALMEQVRAASLPSLAGTAAYTRLDADRVAGNTVLVPRDGLNVAVGLTVPLINVRNWTSWQEASEQVEVARWSAADVRRVVAVATGHAYLSVVRERRLLETAQSATDAARAHYEFTAAQRQGGVGNRLDETRAAQELTTDEVLLQNQQAAVVRAREALGVLVGQDSALDAAEWSFGSLPGLEAALSDAERLRPDVRTSTAAAEANDRAVSHAYADYLPYLSASGAAFFQTPGTATTPTTGWQAQLVLTLPLYEGGLRYGREHERDAIAAQSHLQLEAVLREARSEVRAAFDALQRADLALGQARQSAGFAKTTLELATQAYRGGATTNLEVIDAARHARDADTQAAIAEDVARQARLDLLAASGRFPAL